MGSSSSPPAKGPNGGLGERSNGRDERHEPGPGGALPGPWCHG